MKENHVFGVAPSYILLAKIAESSIRETHGKAIAFPHPTGALLHGSLSLNRNTARNVPVNMAFDTMTKREGHADSSN